MKTYFIYNLYNNESYTKQFENETEARHWVINHLDLSKEWYIKEN